MSKQSNGDTGTVKRLVLHCEHCGKELTTIKVGTRHDVAARAKHAGVWVKNFLLLGDKTGYHYFCDAGCDHAWRKDHLATQNASGEQTSRASSPERIKLMAKENDKSKVPQGVCSTELLEMKQADLLVPGKGQTDE